MRKVLFVHNGPLYRDERGKVFGVHFTDKIIERYKQLGDHVTFLMRSRSYSTVTGRLSEITAPNFRFVAVDDIVSPLNKLRNLRKVRNLIRSTVNDCDLVVARIPSAISTETVKIARQLKKPYMVECVACNFDALWNFNWKGKLAAYWYAHKQRQLIRQAPFVLYVTKSFLQTRYPSQGVTEGISDAAIGQISESALSQRIASIKELSSSSRPLRLATIAELNVPYKSQCDVILALKRLNSRGIICQYHLIGGGNPERLRAVAKNLGVLPQVVFHGSVPHSSIFELLHTMDVYVHPSRTEGLPRAIVESFSVGLPAIGSCVGGIPELLPPTRLFRPGDIEGIAELIESIRSESTLLEDASKTLQVAEEYQDHLLEAKRTRFFLNFLHKNNFL